MNIYKLLLFVLALNFVSCEYEPTGQYLRELDSKGVDNCNILLDPNINDTLILLSESVYIFQLDLDSLARIYSITINVDSTYLGYSGDTTDEFVLDPRKYNSGYHILSIELVASSGTNSMADISGHERRSYSWNWVFFIDKEKPGEPQITNIYPYEGRLMIEWEKYTRVNFQKYRVVGHQWSEGHQSYYREVFDVTITDQDQNYYIDTKYTGGKVYYRLEVFTQNPENRAYTSREYEHAYPYFHLADVYYDSTVLRWAKCPFYNNFNRYIIRNNDGLGAIEIKDINDTVYVDTSLAFGTSTEYTLFVAPNIGVNTISEDYFSVSRVFDRDKRFFFFDKIKPINDSLVCISGTYKLLTYNLNSHNVEQEVSLINSLWKESAVFDVNLGGSDLAYTDGVTVFIVNPVTFEKKASIDMPLNYLNRYSIYNIALSDLGYLSMQLVTSSNPSDVIIYTVDLNTFEPSGTLDLNRSIDNMQYVNNGDLLSFRNYDSVLFYLHDNSELIPYRSFASDGYFLFNNTKDELYNIKRSGTTIRSIRNGNIIKQISTDLTGYFDINIDPFTGYLGYTTPANYMIYDFEKEDHVYQVPLSNVYVQQSPMALINNTLFASYYGGRYLKLEY